MSNVKAIQIVATVPFDFLHQMSAEEAGIVARAALSPSTGIAIRYSNGPVSFRANGHGGQTAVYRMTIEGIEAVSEKALEKWCSLIWQGGGNVESMDVVDLECGIGA